MSESAIPQASDNSYEELFMSCISVVSAIACLFIIIFYLLIFNGNLAYKKFVIALAFSDLLYSLCNYYLAFFSIFYYTPNKKGAYCDFLGFLRQYGFNASTFIVFCISWFFYLAAIDKNDHILNNSNRYIAASMIIPAFVSAWFILSDGIEVEGKWCFPSDFWQVTILVHGFYLVPMIATIILFYISFSIIRRNGVEIGAWPPLLQLCFLPIIVLFQIEHFFPESIADDTKQKLWIIFGTIACLNGFFNGIAYGLNKKTREELKKCGCSKETELRQRLVS